MFFLRNIDDLIKPDGSFYACGRTGRGSEGHRGSALLLILAQKRLRCVRGDVNIDKLPWGLHSADKHRLQRCGYRYCRHCVDGQPPIVFSMLRRGSTRTPTALRQARERWDSFQRAQGVKPGAKDRGQGPCRLLCEGCDADRKSGRLHTIPTTLAHVVSERSPLRSAAYYPCSDQNR